jgi:hypothetical protein
MRDGNSSLESPHTTPPKAAPLLNRIWRGQCRSSSACKVLAQSMMDIISYRTQRLVLRRASHDAITGQIAIENSVQKLPQQ